MSDLGIGIDNDSTDRLTLGIGGGVVEAQFAFVTLRLHRDHAANGDLVEWSTEVGFIEPWDAEFYVILGQIGFFDNFTVSMSRTALTVHVERPDALYDRLVEQGFDDRLDK